MTARPHARLQVDHVMVQGGDLSNILYVPGGAPPPPDLGCGFPRFENLRVDGDGGCDDDPGQVTPDSTLDGPTQQAAGCYGGSASGSSTSGGVPRRKKTGGGFFPQIVLSLGNRRKGAPHRAPLA